MLQIKDSQKNLFQYININAETVFGLRCYEY